MTINRYAARVDGNQAAIVDALRAVGCVVWPIGLPVDLLVGFRGSTILLEVKQMQGKRKPRPKDHTPLQAEFLSSWTGGTVATVTDVDGALRAVRCVGQ